MTWARYTVLVSSSFNSQQPVKPSQGSVATTSLPVLSYRIASVQESSLPPQQRMSISNPSENFAVLPSEEPSPCASSPRRCFSMRSAYGSLIYTVSSRTVFFGSTSTRTWYSAPLYGMTQWLQNTLVLFVAYTVLPFTASVTVPETPSLLFPSQSTETVVLSAAKTTSLIRYSSSMLSGLLRWRSNR